MLAKDHDTAREAASKVTMELSELPSVVSIDEAIAARSFFPKLGTSEFHRGDPAKVFAKPGADV